MERKLFQAFDRQRFQQNGRLAGIINDVESRYARALCDDDLELVSAAGTAEPVMDEITLIPSGMQEKSKDNRIIYTQHRERKDYHD
jgi:hypothetical protein